MFEHLRSHRAGNGKAGVRWIGVERHYLRRALERTGNKARASLLGLASATTLTNRMTKHGVSLPA